MERQGKVFRAIRSEADAIDANVEMEDVFMLDKETGELLNVMLVMSDSANSILNAIRQKPKHRVKYITVYQDTFRDLAKELSGSEAKVLLYLLSLTSFENMVYGITLRGMAVELAISINTAKSALDSLEERKMISNSGTNNEKVYVVNPSIAWKGSNYRKKKQVDIFTEPTLRK